MNKLKLAIIGCGAVTENYHLPALKLCEKAEATVLVDRFLPRAQGLAARYGVPEVTEDYRHLIGVVDGAVIALPNYLHAAVAIELLRNGLHVLVEKPVALNSLECDNMIEAAHTSATSLAGGLVYRFLHAARFVRHVLEENLLGDVVSFDIRKGDVYRWPAATDYLLDKQTAGGGVLIDTGPHVLDLLLWWLGEYDHVDYRDDELGGVEADCELRIGLRSGASGVVELSRSRKLRNTCIIEGERGTLEMGLSDFNPTITLTLKNKAVSLNGRASVPGPIHKSWADVFCCMYNDFAAAIKSDSECTVPGRESRRTVKLIEECYGLRRPLEQPWMAWENTAGRFDGRVSA